MASESKGIFPHSARNSCSLNTLLQTALQPSPAHSRLPLAIGHVGQTGKKATGLVWGLWHGESGAPDTRPNDTCLELPVTSSGTWGWPCLLRAALRVVTECGWKGQVSALCKAVMVPEGGALSRSSGGFPTRRWSEHSADTWEILDRAFLFTIATDLLASRLLPSGDKGH